MTNDNKNPIDYKCDWCNKPESEVGDLHCILSKYEDLQLCPKCFLKYKKYKKLYKTIYKIRYYLRKPYFFIKFKLETKNHKWQKNYNR